MKSGVNLMLDSNAIIAIVNGNEIIVELTQNCNLYTSFITELEVLSYPKISEQEKKVLKGFLKECIIVDINNEIKKNCIELRAKHHLKLPDAIIAGTTMYLDLPLISADKAFNKLSEIIVIQFPS